MLGVSGYATVKPRAAFLTFTPAHPEQIWVLARKLRFRDLIFARQLIFSIGVVKNLPPTDRISSLLAMVRALGDSFSAALIETADTNEAKPLLGFCKRFLTPFTHTLQKMGLLATERASLPRLHLLFVDSSTAYVGISYPDNGSAWFMGIPRLRFPRGAPSRSSLKLEEAWLVFLRAEEQQQRLAPGMHAVDLGAAPGGWTWQLVNRGLRVIAVDNGSLKGNLPDSGWVEHRREDGFRYRPRKPVDWMVCDIAEQPFRIAELMLEWFVAGWCRESIFNLKLPMKRRRDELKRCRHLIETGLARKGIRYRLAFKQLYHDREEVTGYFRRLD